MIKFNLFQTFLFWAVPTLLAITLHEAAHGWAALYFGDPTSKMLGRLSLNPLMHVDMIGTILVPLLAYFLGGFILGWAKPVPVNAQNFKNPRQNMAWVALAGPMANLLMAACWAGLLKLSSSFSSSSWVAAVLINMSYMGVFINLLLAVFNLLPLPPLDGSRILGRFLSSSLWAQYQRLEPYGFWIVLVLLLTGVLPEIINPIISGLHNWLTSLFHLYTYSM